jgi:hypothetical protein
LHSNPAWPWAGLDALLVLPVLKTLMTLWLTVVIFRSGVIGMSVAIINLSLPRWDLTFPLCMLSELLCPYPTPRDPSVPNSWISQLPFPVLAHPQPGSHWSPSPFISLAGYQDSSFFPYFAENSIPRTQAQQFFSEMYEHAFFLLVSSTPSLCHNSKHLLGAELGVTPSTEPLSWIPSFTHHIPGRELFDYSPILPVSILRLKHGHVPAQSQGRFISFQSS